MAQRSADDFVQLKGLEWLVATTLYRTWPYTTFMSFSLQQIFPEECHLVGAAASVVSRRRTTQKERAGGGRGYVALRSRLYALPG